MDGITCDMCGNELLIDDDSRYIVDIQVYAAYDPLEISMSDLKQDFRKAIRELIDKLKTKDPKEVQNNVYRALTFDLCPGCQRKYIKNPVDFLHVGQTIDARVIAIDKDRRRIALSMIPDEAGNVPPASPPARPS